MSLIEHKNLEEIEYLLAQSTQGIHLLFDNPSIAKVFKKPSDDVDLFNFETVSRVQELFTDLIGKKSLYEKQMFLDTLKVEDFELLMRTYFHIVENTILASDNYKH
jgi:hypothetical protein